MGKIWYITKCKNLPNNKLNALGIILNIIENKTTIT